MPRGGGDLPPTHPQGQKAAAAAAPKPWIGKGWEAFFQGAWHPVEVLEVKEGNLVLVKWDWDGSESEIWNHYCRRLPSSATAAPAAAAEVGAAKAAPAPAPAAPAAAAAAVKAAPPPPTAAAAPAPAGFKAAPPKLTPQAPAPKPMPRPVVAAPPAIPSFSEGAAVEGRYGEEWYTAVVIHRAETPGGEVGVKWDYDGSESWLPPSDLRLQQGGHTAAAVEEAPAPPPAMPVKAPPLKPPPGGPGPTLAPPRANKPPAATLEACDARRILELIPKDAPAEVRGYLESLLPAVAAANATWL